MDAGLKSTLLRAVIPVLIGVGVVLWLFIDDFNPEAWKALQFNGRTVIALLLALVAVAGRDFGLTWRFRTITDRTLS